MHEIVQPGPIGLQSGELGSLSASALAGRQTDQCLGVDLAAVPLEVRVDEGSRGASSEAGDDAALVP